MNPSPCPAAEEAALKIAARQATAQRVSKILNVVSFQILNLLKDHPESATGRHRDRQNIVAGKRSFLKHQFRFRRIGGSVAVTVN